MPNPFRRSHPRTDVVASLLESMSVQHRAISELSHRVYQLEQRLAARDDSRALQESNLRQAGELLKAAGQRY